MKSYTHILFDWDGTIAQTLDVWLQALRSVLEAGGHTFSDEEIGANYEIFRQRYEDRFKAKQGDNIIAILESAMEISAQMIPDVKIYPHAINSLRQLRSAGRHLAVVTTSMHAQIDPLLAKHNLTDIFDVVVCADDTINIKPDPEPVLDAMQQLHAVTATTLMVGDSDNDILAAKAAGIDVALYYPSRHTLFHDLPYLKSLEPTFVFNDWRQLVPRSS